MFLQRSRAVDNMSDEIKLLAIENEGAMGCDTTRQTENVDIAVLFLQNVLQANKIIAENKKNNPTYPPNCKKHVTGNTYFFVWPYHLFFFVSFSCSQR